MSFNPDLYGCRYINNKLILYSRKEYFEYKNKLKKRNRKRKGKK